MGGVTYDDDQEPLRASAEIRKMLGFKAVDPNEREIVDALIVGLRLSERISGQGGLKPTTYALMVDVARRLD